MLYMGRRAREAAAALALTSTEAKNDALQSMAARIAADAGKILEANAQDVEAARAKDAAFMDRLALTEARVAAMAKGLCDLTVSVRVASDSEDLGLAGRELLIGEHALSVKVRQVLKLSGCIVLLRRRRRGGRSSGGLLRVLLVVLLFPLGGLTTVHAPGYGGGGSRNDSGTSCHTYKSHVVPFDLEAFEAS